jgi:hypothetical protein
MTVIKPPVRELRINIQSVAGRDREYLAYFRSEPLDATFSVYFHDNLMGALALHEFAEMIRRRFAVDTVRLELSDEAVVFRSRAVLDVLTAKVSGRNV